VFILPSKSETWGLSVNEAMACGLPVVVSTSCGCQPELVIEGVTGYSFNGAAELKYCLQSFSNKEIISKMAQNAIVHVNKFTLEVFASALEKQLNP
jgi:glycosyltransferase involved in cell wall biosynthesis